MQLRKKMQGITLMELMIVVVIIGIITAIAFPNYSAFVARAKRNEARAALLQIATNQEKFYLQNNTFTTNLISLGLPTSPVFTTDSGTYNVTVSAANTADFTATATFIGSGDEENRCATFTITGVGSKTSLPDTDCWTRTR